MDKITHEVRLAQWEQLIKQCQERPEEQTAKEWLSEHDISSKQYYYWLRKVRQNAYNEASGSGLIPKSEAGAPSVASADTDETVTFAELPFSVDNSKGKTAFQAGAVVNVSIPG